VTIPESLLSCLAAFEPCFTAPSYRRFVTLMPGWLVCVGKRTVTGVMRGAGVADQDASGFQRFFSRGAWSPDRVGQVVLRMALRLMAPEPRVELTLDDTLARHTGKHIASAGMHRDPLLSTGAKPYFHFGHNWVVLAVAVTLPWGKTVSLPFFVRLYRTAKAAKAAQVEHFKRTVLAAQMLAELVKYEAKRRFLVFADNAYVNRSVVRELRGLLQALVARGNLRLGQESARLRGPAQPHRACGAAHRADGAVGLLHRRGLVRELGAQTQDAADATGKLVPRQDRAELRGHVGDAEATVLDDLGL
jgi:hypothetical protein